MHNNTIYQEMGYSSRKHYLQCLSENYDLPLEVVHSLAQLLGQREDWDGLITALEDAEGMF